eukprot:SAG11_NODE_55_length_19449_cov_28.630135_3_plen_450_part_00
MGRPLRLLLAAAAVGLLPTRIAGPAGAGEPPHVLLMLADDLGHSDVGFNGNTAVAARDPQLKTETPTLDALARSGTTLRWHYSCHVCTPTRAMLMTGRYASRFGAQHRVFLPGSPRAVPLNETILAERLKARGFRTALVGKWHLGFYAPQFVPTARGFDFKYGYYTGDESYINHTCGPCLNQARGCVVPHKPSAPGPVLGFRDPCGRDWTRNDRPLKFEDTGEWSPYVFSRVSREVIANHSRDHATQPLFLHLAMQTTHAPYEAPDDVLAKYSHISYKNRKPYAALIELCDDTVKNVTEGLREHGMMDKTIIVFLSDNGGPCMASGTCPQRPQSSCACCNLPLKGYKHSLHEGGIRTPAFITGPGVTHGRVIPDFGSFFHVSDWFPTILSATERSAGGLYGEQPTDKPQLPLDGLSAWAALSSADRPLPRSSMIIRTHPYVMSCLESEP